MNENEIVNEIIHVSNLIDELWNYHPDNPNCVDVKKEYNDLQVRLKSLEDECDGVI